MTRDEFTTSLLLLNIPDLEISKAISWIKYCQSRKYGFFVYENNLGIYLKDLNNQSYTGVSTYEEALEWIRKQLKKEQTIKS